MSTEVIAKRVDGDSIENLLVAGDFKWAGDRLVFICLCGCSGIAGIKVRLGDHADGFWGWDGNRDRPTCTPSIQIHSDNNGCPGWHGHLVDGVFRSCD